MAVAVIPKPTLWRSYNQELFKGSSQIFYKLVLVVPIVIPLVIMVVQVGVKIFSQVETGVPDSSPFTNMADLGMEGTFAISNRLMFVQLGTVYGAIVVISAALSVANEYRCNTIKMLATRQPSRIKLVLSKCLFALSLVFGTMLSVIVGWFLWAMFLKFFYSVSLEITSADVENMGKGLRYFAIISLQTGVMALFAIAITFLFKSVVAGAIGFLVYTGLDSFVSVIGAQFGNGVIKNVPEWAMPFLRYARDMNPFLVGSSTNRLTMQEQLRLIVPNAELQSNNCTNLLTMQGQYDLLDQTIPNSQIIVSNPIWLAWTVLGVYALIFTILAVLFFTLRDVRD